MTTFQIHVMVIIYIQLSECLLKKLILGCAHASEFTLFTFLARQSSWLNDNKFIRLQWCVICTKNVMLFLPGVLLGLVI